MLRHVALDLECAAYSILSSAVVRWITIGEDISVLGSSIPDYSDWIFSYAGVHTLYTVLCLTQFVSRDGYSLDVSLVTKVFICLSWLQRFERLACSHVCISDYVVSDWAVAVLAACQSYDWKYRVSASSKGWILSFSLKYTGVTWYYSRTFSI